MNKTRSIHPRLVVDNAAMAIDFYKKAFGAVESMRFADPSGKVVQAEIEIGDTFLSLTEDDGNCNLSPTSIGGSPVLLSFQVPDADKVGTAMASNGATVIIPIEDRYYGRREGRIQDPAGHLWIISQHLEDLSHDEITKKLTDN